MEVLISIGIVLGYFIAGFVTAIWARISLGRPMDTGEVMIILFLWWLTIPVVFLLWVFGELIPGAIEWIADKFEDDSN